MREKTLGLSGAVSPNLTYTTLHAEKTGKANNPTLINGKETPLLHRQHAVRKMPHIISMKT
jgi:hypothetical protein